MNSQQQYMQMLNSPILSPCLNQADVYNVPPPWAVALANSIRSVDQKVYDVSKKLQKLERVEAKMADFEKNLSNLSKCWLCCGSRFSLYHWFLTGH